MAYTPYQKEVIDSVMNNCVPYKNSNDFSVYFHLRNDTKEVFYVGMGKKWRPMDTGKHNKYWNHTVKKAGGHTVVVVKDGLTRDEASELEKYYISILGRKVIDENGLLVNLAIGGEGNAGIPKPHLRTPVNEYDIKGNFIKRHESITSTAKDGHNFIAVRQNVELIRKRTKNSIFIKESEKCPALLSALVAYNSLPRKFSESAIENIKNGMKSNSDPIRSIVIKKDLSGNYVDSFSNLSSAARHIGYSRGHGLTKALKKNEVVRGFKWEVKDVRIHN